ncbi:MAG TPA: hypothetical protein DCE43_11155 [Planctomycetaceae bacterium]|nr:hypothetical protein [Planctomycetaceae bacterium]HCK53512.1 hypothetical protein [Planctomycetaceae bacterium]|tara:strand:+ start:3161 stop:3826 length:666 start_codon:yes stop_codon:yes gene_type:complete
MKRLYGITACGNRGLGMLVLFAGVVLFAVVTLAVSEDVGRRLIADDGLVQVATFVVLSVAVLLAANGAIRDPLERVFLGLTVFLLVLYAAREADLHRADWVPEHFSSLKFYLSADVPLVEKAVCGSFLLAAAVAAVLVILRAVPKIRPAFRARQPWLMFSLAWAGVFVASQISDQSSWNLVFEGQAFEEIAEFMASGFVVLTVLRYPINQGQRDGKPQSAG